MTRLKENWVRQLEKDLPAYEQALVRKTGLDFTGIAARTSGLNAEAVTRRAKMGPVAVVPVTSGLGVIGGFSSAVAAIIGAAGFDILPVEGADVDGLYEAAQGGAGMVFMADDERFISLRLEDGKLSENNEATARGYVELLEVLHGAPLAGAAVLVLGCGPVGRLAAEKLQKKGALPVLYDQNSAIMEAACAVTGARKLGAQEGFAGFGLVVDATNTGGWLKAEMLHPKVLLAAPGVPLSLDEAGQKACGAGLLHDMLHIGTLAMLGQLCGP